MCKVYTGYHGTIEIEHGLCACTVGNPRAKAKAWGLSFRTGAQTILSLYLAYNIIGKGMKMLTCIGATTCCTRVIT